MTDETWRPTGWLRLKTSWFGRCVLEEQQVRRVFVPVMACHSPANWQLQYRWHRSRAPERTHTSSSAL